MFITINSTKLELLYSQVTINGDFRMNKSIDQTKQHTETTMVRWTKDQLETIRNEAFQQRKAPAVFIREFLLENHPAFKPKKTDERL